MLISVRCPNTAVFPQGCLSIVLIVAPASTQPMLVLAFVYCHPTEREDTMLKRDRLKAMLRKITDKQFNAIWKETYGYVPFGDRSDLVADFVAEQYDEELDGCIKRAESLLKAVPKPKVNRWLVPR